jgi:hypothetical protein
VPYESSGPRFWTTAANVAPWVMTDAPRSTANPVAETVARFWRIIFAFPPMER